MIIGHGDIASVLTDRPDRLFFASGVSNSQEQREGEYAREAGLLLSQDPTAHVVYFSSASIFYANGRYQRHKRFMENAVKGHFRQWTILRLGNITWGTNPHTLINHLVSQQRMGMPLDIQPVYRWVVSQAEFWWWLDHIPERNCEIGPIGRMMTVQQIVDELLPLVDCLTA